MASSNTSAHKIIVKVAIAVPLRRLFDYFLPSDSMIHPKPGMRVEVPFGSSNKIGFIDSVLNTTQTQPSTITSEKIKPIGQILDHYPLINDTLISLYQWMCRYYHAPPGEVWQTMLPTALLKGKKAELIRMSYWKMTPEGQQAFKENKVNPSAVKQRLALQQLAQNSQIIAHDRLKDFGLTYANMKTLAAKRWVTRDFFQTESAQDIQHLINQPKNIQLNKEQQYAIEQVTQSLATYQSFLLFGVTASGKTEVYLRLIQQVIEKKQQALVLVPEIGLTPQTLNRFENRFNVNIVLLHSGMSEQQRLQSWLSAQNGEAQIIIGTRSAIFTPLKNPGIIIIDEEHDLSFKQQQGFRYSARDVAMVRANFEKIPVLLGSASPSLESLMNVKNNKMTQLNLNQKAQTNQALNYHVIDLKNEPMKQGLSNQLINAIKKHLNEHGQILLFLNRRGYAPVLLCHQCGWSSSCTRCDLHFTYHHQNHFLECHHCGSNRKAPNQCPECHSQQMIPIGFGTERLQETIQDLFPTARIARVDRDTTRTKSAMNNYVNSIKSGQVDILIGTQMLAKGHHFPNVTLVGLIDMDSALYSADFRAPEYAAQLITQVSGRAGRADKSGDILIQTHHINHPMLGQVIHTGYAEFAKLALQERLETELPPYTYSAMFQAESPQIGYVKFFLQEVKNILDRYSDLKIELLGPAPAVYAKKAGKFRYQLFLQSKKRNKLHQLLKLTIGDIENLKSARRVRWRLEIDPIND